MKFYNYLTEERFDVKKLVVLTTKPENKEQQMYSTAQKLYDTASKMGLKPYTVYIDSAWITIDKDKNEYVIHNEGDEKGYIIDQSDTVIIIRGSSLKYDSSMDLISQLERAGFFVINSRNTMEICSDKFRTVLRLAESGVPGPKSRMLQNEESIESVVGDFDSDFPYVLKTIKGSKGVGVFMVRSISDMKAILQTIWKINPTVEMMIQEYIKADRDYRVHVLGGEVIAAMERIRKTDDFRTNFSLGNSVKNIPVDKISDEMKKIAIKSAKLVDGIWCGVDIIKNKKGNMFVLEVNSSPGTKGIDAASHSNISKTVINYVIDKDNWYITPLEIGYLEWIEIEPIGKIKAKFDTGNGNDIVLHSDKFEIKGNKITWYNNGNIYTHKLFDTKEVFVGGLRGYEETRPMIKTNITFNNVVYKDVIVCLDDRGGRIPALIDRKFIKKINAVVNPNKKFTIFEE